MTPTRLQEILDKVDWPYPKIKRLTGYDKQYIWQMLKTKRAVNMAFVSKFKDAVRKEIDDILETIARDGE